MSYFKHYAEALASELKLISQISEFTNNTAVIGLYAEKIVTDFLRKAVSPLNLSSGAIISPEDFNNGNKALAQIDIIVWSSNPLPPIFHIDECALVPRNSVFAILEIKKSDYDSGLDDIDKRYTNSQNILPDFCTEDSFLSIICIVQKRKLSGDNKLTKLLKKTDRVQYLLCYDEDKNVYEFNHKGILEIVNFLGAIRKLHKDVGNEFHLNIESLDV